MKKTFPAFPDQNRPVQLSQPTPLVVRGSVRKLAKQLRQLGRWAMLVSFVVGLFAAKAASAKLGFLLLLPSGTLLIAIAGYLVKQVRFFKFRLQGRQAELFAYVLGGCSLIALGQVLLERFVFHTL